MSVSVHTSTGAAIIDVDNIAAVVLADTHDWGLHTEIHMVSGTIFSALSYKGVHGDTAHEWLLRDLAKQGWE